MPKDWKDITDDEVLNFEGAQTAIMARYERIMDKKAIDALMEVRMGLFDVKKSMHIVTDKLEARLIEAEKIQKEAATSQHKLQRAGVIGDRPRFNLCGFNSPPLGAKAG